MNKSEFVEAIATGMGGTKVDASRFLEIFQLTVTKALRSGNHIMIPGFGSFTVAQRAARTGVNPKNGQKLHIKATKVPKFKAGKSLKEAVQA